MALSVAPFRRFVAACLVLPLLGCATLPPVAGPWPSPVVPIEQMRSKRPLLTTMPMISVEKGGQSTVMLRAHVDAEGRTRRVTVDESSGSPELDEAAMHTLRNANFVPYRVDGVPSEVTVVARMNYPVRPRQR